MFGVDFMWGAMFFGALQTATLLIGLLIFYKIISIAWKHRDDMQTMPAADRKSLFRWINAGIVFAVFGFFLALGPIRPKVTIQTIPNRAAIEYQSNTTPPVIVTPPPRVEYMEGFRPLKRD